MTTTVNDLIIRILGKSDGLSKELSKSKGEIKSFVGEVDKSTKQISALGNVVQGVFQGIGQALTGFVAQGVRNFVGEIGKATKAASDLNETVSKTQAVFRDSSQDILAWSKTTTNAFGLTQQGALSAAASLGNMFKQLGTGTEDAATFSKSIVGLAGDLVAFHNVAGGTEEVLQDIQSAFRGEYDPIQKYIPVLTAASVQQQALADTGKKSADQLSALEKAMATQAIIVRNMGDAYGAAAREINSAASQQRIFDAKIADSAARIGQVFLPVQQAFFRGLNQLIDVVAPYGENIMDSLASGLARGIAAILPVLQQVRALFVYWLKPGSPPRLLRELTDWGKSAMQEYLRGWTLADFDALERVGGIMERVIRGFASSGDIKETDLVGRVFGSQKAISQAIREFKELGYVTEGTFGAIADAVGPAGTEVAELTRRYFDLQRATKGVKDAQVELNGITDKYAKALRPVNDQLDAIDERLRDLDDQRTLEELGKVLLDPHATVNEREQARLRIEKIRLEDHRRAIEGERDTALDAAQQKIDAAQKEEAAQQQKYAIAEAALDQQAKTNALIAEETTLRQRLIDEGIAEQKRVLSELEAEQRKAAAETERIADAQLRWQLASTDTAGQLAIMQEQLAKTVEGTAEYYDILTQIISLRERLDKEGDKGGGGLLPSLQDALGTPADVQATSQGIKDLSAALDAAFAALSGGDGKTVELAPAWQNFADTLGTIGDTAKEVRPLITEVIGIIMGSDEGSPATADPFGDNWWLAGIVPGIRNIKANLELFRDKDWAGLWAGFKEYVNDTLNSIDPGADPRSFTFYSWLKDSLIPAIDALAIGDWKTAWDNFIEAPLAAIQSILDKINELFGLEEKVQEFMGRMGFPTNPSDPGSGINPNKRPQGHPEEPGARSGDFSFLVPQAFQGLTPQSLSPAVAGNTSTVGDTYFIEQNIATNGDFGGARAGAEEGIRQALINRRRNGA